MPTCGCPIAIDEVMRILLAVIAACELHAAVSWTFPAAPGQQPVAREILSTCVTDSAGFSSWAEASGVVKVHRVLGDSNGFTWLGGTEQTALVVGAPSVAYPWIAKLDRNGCILFTARLHAEGYSIVYGLAVDAAGRIWAAGSTTSQEFPVRIPFTGSFASGRQGDGFLFRLSADGSQLLWSNYVDGFVRALAIDAAENIYLTGRAQTFEYSDTLKLSDVALRDTGPSQVHGAFILKVSPIGDRVLLGGYIAGNRYVCSGGSTCDFATRSAHGTDIAIDQDDNILIAGQSSVLDLPGGAGPGPFVAKIRQGTTPSLVWIKSIATGTRGSYPLISPSSSATTMTVNNAGEIFVGGGTVDPDFPATRGTIQPTYSGPTPNPFQAFTDGYLVKLSASGSIVWGTFLGERGTNEVITSVGVDSAGSIWAVARGEQSADQLVRLAADGSARLYSESWQSGSLFPIPARVGELLVSGTLADGYYSGVVRGLRVSEMQSRRIAVIAHAANQRSSSRISPGQLLTLYGPSIGVGTPEVFFNANSAPILFVGENQINVIVPTQLTPGTPATIEVRSAGMPAIRYLAQVVEATPELFRRPDGSAIALNQDGSVNSAENPARPGSVVVLYATGTGSDGRPAGTVATGPFDRRCCVVTGTGRLEVIYGGDAPGLLTALSQINVRLLDVSGDVQVTLAGSTSDALVYVR